MALYLEACDKLLLAETHVLVGVEVAEHIHQTETVLPYVARQLLQRVLRQRRVVLDAIVIKHHVVDDLEVTPEILQDLHVLHEVLVNRYVLRR